MTAYRSFRQNADDIESDSEEVKKRDFEAFRKEQSEPWLFELLMSNRKTTECLGKQVIKPYMEHPEYLKRIELQKD